MPKPGSDEVLTQKHIRFWTQPGGPHPANSVFYSGVANAYMNIENVTNPRRGGVEPINVHDPTRIGLYRQVGSKLTPPDFATFTVNYLQAIGALPRHLVDALDCVTNFYQVAGRCKDPSDFLTGWDAYVKIFSRAVVDDTTEAGGAFDSDDQLQDDVSYTATFGVYNAGKISFGEKATTEVYSELIDVVYGSNVQCGDCGPPDNGSKRIYAVANNTVASPGQSPSVFYSLDKGATVTEVAITGATSTDVPQAIDIVGQYLIVVFSDATTGGYYYSELNRITGAPSSTWTKVTTGFVSGSQPTDIYVASSAEIWFSGNNGYIYKAANIATGVSVKDAGDATTENLNRVIGFGDTLLFAGNNGKIVASLNNGETFSATAADPSANNINAVDLSGDFLWWVGDASGGLFYSQDQGASWTTYNLPASVTGIHDIVIATPEVIWVSTTGSGPVATLYTSWNGGVDFASDTPRILNWPVFDRGNRIAYPNVSNLSVAVNNVAIAGLAGNGSDGILLVGVASTQ